MYSLYKKTLSSHIDELDTEPFKDLFIDDSEFSNGEVDVKEEGNAEHKVEAVISEKRKKWHKRKKKRTESEKNTDSDLMKASSVEVTKESGAIFPNYLIAIQITNPKISAGIQQVQEHVVSQDERLEPSLQPIGLLHLSMFMIHLAAEEEVTRAKHALDQCKQDLRKLYKDQLLSLDISGLGNFRDKVVFAKIKTEEQENRLQEIASIIKKCFQDQRIISAAKHEAFAAHVTVLNLSRDRSSKKKGGIKKIDRSVYEKYIETDFGCQYANTLQLCPMQKKKVESGYYDVEYSVQFGPDIKDSMSELVPTLSW